MNIRYTINENEEFAIRMWNDDNPYAGGEPFFYQPDWPDGTKWASYEEADTWAKRYIAMMENKENGAPGSGPDNPFIGYDPTKDPSLIKKSAEDKARELGLTEEEIQALKI